jgi:hypothetical protein
MGRGNTNSLLLKPADYSSLAVRLAGVDDGGVAGAERTLAFIAPTRFKVTVPETTSPASYALASVATVTSKAHFGSEIASHTWWSSWCSMTAGEATLVSGVGSGGGDTRIVSENSPADAKPPGTGWTAVSMAARAVLMISGADFGELES